MNLKISIIIVEQLFNYYYLEVNICQKRLIFAIAM
nr:MAG TPA: hypothetical protein [Caudoviricetes sp.]